MPPAPTASARADSSDLPAAAERRRARGIQAIRLLVSGALLFFLVTKIDAEHLVPDHPSMGTLAFLAAGLVLMSVSFVLAAWRWQRVLRVFDIAVPVRRLLHHYLAGQFVGNVLPSTIGGDVLRITRVAPEAGGREVAFASVVLERLTGFIALPLLAFLGFLARPDLVSTTTGWIALAIALGTVGALALVLFLANHERVAGRFTNHENWMRYIGVIHLGVDRLRRDKRDACIAVAASVAYQAVVVGAVYCAVHTLGIDLPNVAILAFVPAVAMAQVLPISVSGLGVREGLLVVLLHPLGVPAGEAVAIGLLWYAMTLVVSLAGAPAFALHQRPDSPRVAARRLDYARSETP